MADSPSDPGGEPPELRPDKPAEPSIGDLVRTDQFQSALEAARKKREAVRAQRGETASSGPKLRPREQAPALPSRPARPDRPQPAVPEAAPPARPHLLTGGRRPVAAPLPAEPEEPVVRRRRPVGRRLLASAAGIMIGFAAGAVAMDLIGRQISVPSFGRDEASDIGTIQPARGFSVVTEAPAGPGTPIDPDPSAIAPTQFAAARVSLPDLPTAPRDGVDAEPPGPLSPLPPPLGGLDLATPVVVVGPDEGLRGAVSDRLSALGLADVGERATEFSTETTLVRFYKEADAALAQRLASRLGGEVQDLTSFRPAPEDRLIEVWTPAE